MTKEIKTCKAEINRLLSENAADTDWNREAENLLVKIKFFQHERIVHLIVTMTMSILTVITVCALFIAGASGEAIVIPVILLFVLFLALTAAYLAHYYKLENGVQELYKIYQKLQENCQKM
ncbi:MAG: hypothetical protein FWG44_05040 [Oscillospiraceae bacterium]|nr:hypothetical protein [Oscillospiraceae bacterium]